MPAATTNVTVKGLLIEYNRLKKVIAEGKRASAQIKLLNKLIASYGLELEEELDDIEAEEEESSEDYCDLCDAGPFKGCNGLAMHKSLVHDIRGRTSKLNGKKK